MYLVIKQNAPAFETLSSPHFLLKNLEKLELHTKIYFGHLAKNK